MPIWWCGVFGAGEFCCLGLGLRAWCCALRRGAARFDMVSRILAHSCALWHCAARSDTEAAGCGT